MDDKLREMLNSLNLTNSDLEYILKEGSIGPFNLIEIVGSGIMDDGVWSYTEFLFYVVGDEQSYDKWRGYQFTGRVFHTFIGSCNTKVFETEVLGERNYMF